MNDATEQPNNPQSEKLTDKLASITGTLGETISDKLGTTLGGRWAGLKDRTLYGTGLAVVALIVIWAGGWVFSALVIAAGLQMLREWDALTEEEDKRWKLYGLAYVAVPCACMVWLRHIGASPVLFVLLVVAATDIGAYFTGREIGGPKLAPSISPGKTWAGLGGGALAAAIVATICSGIAPFPESAPSAFALGILLALVSQGGDLFESWLKRRADVKDSGDLIPGHGGLLDRVDGLTTALPVYTLLFWGAGFFS